MRSRVGILAFTSLSAAVSSAQALDPQHYHPAATLTGLAAVKGAASEAPLVPTLSLTSIYAKDPLVLVDENGERVGSLVGNRVDLVLAYAMGLLDAKQLSPVTILEGIDLAAIVPYVAYQGRDAQLSGNSARLQSSSDSGLADPRLEARLSFALPEGIDVALIPVLSFPASGEGSSYISNGSVVFTPEVAASFEAGPVLLAANIGFRVRRDQEVDGIQMRDQLVWRGGVGLDVTTDVSVGLEAWGLTRGAAPFRSIRQSPTEALGSVRVRVGDAIVNAGGGAGLNEGYGTPQLRAVLGVAWAPRVFDMDGDGIGDDVDACIEVPEDLDGFEDTDGCPDPDNDQDRRLDDDDACPDEPEDIDNFKDDDGCPDLDNDNDGVSDLEDACPTEPEDMDGFQDADGCPDLDNDDDGIPDARDKCRDEPEDKDNFDDADGCIDPDNDGDGIPDDKDKCPTKAEDLNGFQDDDGCPDDKDDKDGDGIPDKLDKCKKDPEDKDGFEDEDGCPDDDNDKDGVKDHKDACKNEPEDKDGFMDEDGCPEEDNDGDGIWDEKDKCPNEAEVINGVDDDDGCPDQGAQLVKLTAQKIEIAEKVYFDTASDVIQSRSYALLDQVAAVMKNHEHVKKVRVEGHTDDRGGDDYNLDLSQRRADSVRRYLVDKGGVQPERLEAVGYGETRAIATNKTAAGREVNRRVEFTIIDQEGQ